MDTEKVVQDYQKKQKKNNRLVRATVAFLILDIFEILILFLSQSIIDESIISLIFNVFRGIFSIYFVVKLVKYKKMFAKLMIIATLIVILYVASIMINPKILFTMNRDLIVGFIGTWVPAIAIGIILQYNEGYFFDTVVRFLPFLYTYLLITFLFLDLGTVYQNLAYNVLVFAVSTVEVYFRKRKLSMLVNAVILAFVLVISGARGPILSLFIFGLWLFWKYTANSKKWRFIAIFAVMVGGFLLISFNESTKYFLSQMFPDSRIIEMIMSGDLFDSGRDSIYAYCIEALQSRWFTFGGMMSDRYYLVDTFMNTQKLGFWILDESAYSSVYAHNLFLELCFCFGTLLGIIISVVLVWKIINNLRHTANNSNNIMIMLICVGFVPLMFTSSLWASTYFWIMIGFMLRSRRRT